MLLARFAAVCGILFLVFASFSFAATLGNDYTASNYAVANPALNSASLKEAITFKARENASLSSVFLYVNPFVSTTNESLLFKVSVQGARADGAPNGVIQNYGLLDAKTAYGWNQVQLLSPVGLTTGVTYNVVIEYFSGKIDANNFMQLLSVSGVGQPDSRWAVDLKEGAINTWAYGPNGNVSIWSLQNKTPIFVLVYSDGRTVGQPWSDKLTNEVYAHLWYSQRFVVPQAISVSSIGAFVGLSFGVNVSRNDDLWVQIRYPNNTALTPFFVLISRSSLFSPTPPRWFDLNLNASIVLPAGSYDLVFQSRYSLYSGLSVVGVYQLYGLTDAYSGDYRIHNVTYGGQNAYYRLSTKNGTAWDGPHVDADLSFRMTYQNLTTVPACSDGTPLNSCSLTMPLYCTTNGTLVERASWCGCPMGKIPSNDSCVFTQISENYTCVFSGSTNSSKSENCYAAIASINATFARFGCFNTCSMTVSGPVDASVIWTSTCGGTTTTRLGNASESKTIYFTCINGEEKPPAAPLMGVSSSASILAGWNFVSFPVSGALVAKDSGCANLKMRTYRNGKYETANLFSLKGGEGYLIYSAAMACTLNYDAVDYLTPSNYSQPLVAGWNLIGAPSGTTLFANLVGNCAVSSGPWTGGSSTVSKSTSLVSGKGYWVKVASACTLRPA